MNNSISISVYNSDATWKIHFTKLTKKEMENLKSPGSIKEMKFEVKVMMIMMVNCFPIRNALGLDRIHWWILENISGRNF